MLRRVAFVVSFGLTISSVLLQNTTSTITVATTTASAPPASQVNVRQQNETAVSSFSYDESDRFGPSNWKLINPTCGGFQQSPINIETSTVKRGNAPPLFMSYFTKPVLAINVTNNGHSVHFRLIFADSKPNRLYWNGLKGKVYIFDSLHFHWGNFCGGGSEHTVDGHRYAAEVHLVHINEKYKHLDAALLQPDGLLVVGVFYEISEESNNDGSNNNKFTKFLTYVRQFGQSFLIREYDGIFTIQQLIKNEVREYYSYKGSLTTPGCAESVRWIVSKKTVKIYPSEIAELSKILKEGNTLPLTRNYRPLQQINGRNIYEYNYAPNYAHKFDQLLWKAP